MVRLIDETKLIDEVNDLMDANLLFYDDASKSRQETLDEILDLIDEQPKVGEWIPVEKRLPEQSLNSVIGWDTYRERCVFVQYYMNEWILGNHESVNIVAWQPLPEPYKGEPK